MTAKYGVAERHRWVASLTLGGVEKGVLRVLADYAHWETLKCWPSTETIVRASGFCERTVQSAIECLVTAEVIDIQASRGRKPNIYLLRIPNPAADAGLQKPNPAADAPLPRRRCGVNPAADAPEQVKKQVKEQVSYCSPGGERPSAFLIFYSAYPRKVAKPKAEQVWKRKKLDQKLSAILADLEKRKSNGCWEEAKYIPHPASYLNQERWRDEDSPSPTRHRGVVL